MNDPDGVYFLLNRIEGFIWLGVAVVLPFHIPSKTRKETLAVLGACVGFIAFGFTDFLETISFGNLPPWLWAGKIACVAFLLCCRFTYKGWRNFRLTDRYFIFAILCLAAAIVIIISSQR